MKVNSKTKGLEWKLQCNADLPKVFIAITNPIPGDPSKLSFGIAQSSKIKLQVEDPRIPNLSSFLPSDKPKEEKSNFHIHTSTLCTIMS